MGAERTSQRRGVESEEFVSVDRATWVLFFRVAVTVSSGGGGVEEMGCRAGLNGIAVILEAGNRALGIVDFQDPFDLAVKNRTVEGDHCFLLL